MGLPLFCTEDDSHLAHGYNGLLTCPITYPINHRRNHVNSILCSSAHRPAPRGAQPAGGAGLMEVFAVIFWLALIWGVCGWILMLILGAIGFAVGFWPCVFICMGLTVLKWLL